MANYYCDWSMPNDLGDGLAPGSAKKHIMALINDVIIPAGPILSEVAIFLNGSLAIPDNFNYGADEQDKQIELDKITIAGPGRLTILPFDTIWDDALYEEGKDPFGGPAFDPTGGKPCYVPPIKISGNKNVTVKGVAIQGDGAANQTAVGILAQDDSWANLHYCAAENYYLGSLVSNRSWVNFYNCHFNRNGWALACFSESSCGMWGDNHLINGMQGGVFCGMGSRLAIKAWQHKKGMLFTLLAQTDEYRFNYAALKAVNDSGIFIDEGLAAIVPNMVTIARAKIINNSGNYEAKNYNGVVLESLSKLVGARNLLFSDPTINEGKPTVPAEQWVVAATGQGAIVID